MPNKQQKHSNGKNVVQLTYEFPVKPEPWTFGRFIYDKKAGSYLGRTPKNWSQLGLFYLIFFAVLVAMFAICLQGLFATLSDEYPKWQLDRSIIGSSPGMSFRPLLDVESGNSAIKYEASSKKNVNQWVRSLNEFLQIYTNITTPSKTKRVPCDYDKPPKAGEVCKFEIKPAFGDCADNSSFGFDKSAPCVFLKLNKIFGWVPEYFNNSADLHPDMPVELVNHIKSINNTLELNQIWLSCKGQQNDTVREIKFVGSRGFPGYFYPFMNLEGYQSPLVR